MFIEDILAVIAQNSSITMNTFDRNLVNSFYSQIFLGRSLTEKQATLAVKTLKKHKHKLDPIFNQDISTFLENPQFKNPFRVVKNSKTIKIKENADRVKNIHMEFPYNEEIIKRIRSDKEHFKQSAWNGEEKAWVFSLEERSIDLLSSIGEEFQFDFDEEFKEYVHQVKEVKKNFENYIPTVVKDGNFYKIVNLPPHVEANLSSDLLQSLFDARKLGVTVWSSEIENELNSDQYDDSVKQILKSLLTESYRLILEDNPLSSIKNIVKYLFPCLVTVPGGSELVKLKQAVEFFKDIGLENNEISVLVRLSNDRGKDFNEYVRENKFNSPLSDTTKVVVLSAELPKPILNPRRTFHSVLNFNYYDVDYRLREYVYGHPNVITVMEKNIQGTKSWLPVK